VPEARGLLARSLNLLEIEMGQKCSFAIDCEERFPISCVVVCIAQKANNSKKGSGAKSASHEATIHHSPSKNVSSRQSGF
jgi:hypothetical protein